MMLVAAVFFVATAYIYEDPNDPGFSAQDFPRGVVVLIGIFGLTLFLRSLPELRKSGWRIVDSETLKPTLYYVLPIIILGFSYVWLLELAQYLIPTVLVTSVALALFGNRGLVRLVIVPLAGGLVYYTLFYGILGLFEAPGSLISYENTAYFQPLREFVGSQ